LNLFQNQSLRTTAEDVVVVVAAAVVVAAGDAVDALLLFSALTLTVSGRAGAQLNGNA
jgi:hypothetical protein